MEDMTEMKDEWRDMMESKEKMDRMMQNMPMEGMDDMKMEWDKMTESMNKIQEMMMKGM